MYEEYAAFLLPRERKFSESLKQIFLVDEIQNVSFDEIKSKRVKSIICEQKIPQNKLTNQVIANINKMIILAETPYRQGKEIVFPIIELEKVKDKSYQDFAKKIFSIMNQGIYKYDKDRKV